MSRSKWEEMVKGVLDVVAPVKKQPSSAKEPEKKELYIGSGIAEQGRQYQKEQSNVLKRREEEAGL